MINQDNLRHDDSSNVVTLRHITSCHTKLLRRSAYRIIEMEINESHIQYAHRISRSIPKSVVSPGKALAMSAMAYPSCCILPVLANMITVLALVVIIPRRTTPKRKSGCIMIPIFTGQID